MGNSSSTAVSHISRRFTASLPGVEFCSRVRNFIRHAGEKSCVCDVHGGADRSSERAVPRQCTDTNLVPDHAVELVVSDRCSREHAPPGHAPPTWHTMGVKCMPPAWHTAPHGHFSFNQTLQHTCQERRYRHEFFFLISGKGKRASERLFRPGRTACRLPGRWRPAVTTDAVT